MRQKMGIYQHGKLVEAFEEPYDAYENAVNLYAESGEPCEVKFVEEKSEARNVSTTDDCMGNITSITFWDRLKDLFRN